MNVYAILDFILELEKTPSTTSSLSAGNSDFDLGVCFVLAAFCVRDSFWYIFKSYYVISTLIQIQFCGRNFISVWCTANVADFIEQMLVWNLSDSVIVVGISRF